MNNIQNKNREKPKTALSGATNTKTGTITHKTQHKTGYLNMAPNQRQWLTPASDWEPYQAQTQKQTNKTSNIECPLRSHPDQTKHRTYKANYGQGVTLSLSLSLPLSISLSPSFSLSLAVSLLNQNSNSYRVLFTTTIMRCGITDVKLRSHISC